MLGWFSYSWCQLFFCIVIFFMNGDILLLLNRIIFMIIWNILDCDGIFCIRFIWFRCIGEGLDLGCPWLWFNMSIYWVSTLGVLLIYSCALGGKTSSSDGTVSLWGWFDSLSSKYGVTSLFWVSMKGELVLDWRDKCPHRRICPCMYGMNWFEGYKLSILFSLWISNG